jgi:hypothetical protein
VDEEDVVYDHYGYGLADAAGEAAQDVENQKLLEGLRLRCSYHALF